MYMPAAGFLRVTLSSKSINKRSAGVSADEREIKKIKSPLFFIIALHYSYKSYCKRYTEL